jgi:hypothetical protein
MTRGNDGGDAALLSLEHHDFPHVLEGQFQQRGKALCGTHSGGDREDLMRDVPLDQEVVDVDAAPHVRKYGGLELLGSAFAADPLVELHAVALLGRIAAFLSADTADLTEELLTVTLLGGHAALPTGFRP